MYAVLPYHVHMAQGARTPQESQEAQPEVEKLPEKKPEKQPEAKQAEEKPKFHFQVLADHTARWEQSEHWKNVPVGHAWVRLVNPIGLADSWGFWPGEEVPVAAPWTSVRGEVRTPDEEHTPAGQTISTLDKATFEIDEAAAQRVAKVASNKTSDPGQYNLLNYNCADFALELAKAAGVDVPMEVLANIANPSTLYANLAQLERARAADTKVSAAAGGGDNKK
jgi:hypothetical protein